MGRSQDAYETCLKWCQQEFDRYSWSCVVLDVSSNPVSVTYVNPAYSLLTGYELREAKRSLLISDSSLMRGNRLLANALADGFTQSIELLVHRKDGEYLLNRVRVAPLYSGLEDCRYMMVLLFDASHLVLPRLELHSSEECDDDRCVQLSELLHFDRLKTMGTMAASIAHEINNPVSGVTMNLQYLIDDCQDHVIREILQDSLDEMRRISRLVHGLLSFSRKKQEVNAQHINFSTDVVSRIQTIVHSYLIGNMVEFVNELPPSLPTLYADSDALQQVLLNVISNAVYAVKDNLVGNRFIWLSCEVRDLFVIISVRDNGSGIPEQLRAKIFDAFITTKPKEEGTGLGLSLSTNLMIEFGGKLVLDEGYLHGAKFDLYVPIAHS